VQRLRYTAQSCIIPQVDVDARPIDDGGGVDYVGYRCISLIYLLTPKGVLVALAHWVLEPVRLLLERGVPITPAIAASFGRTAELVKLLASATGQERQDAFGLAVINRQVEAARACLDAGADVNAPLPVHKHSRALHQASVNNHIAMLELLIERGADTQVRDSLWNGTPLGWAAHNGKSEAEAFLRGIMER
jgi:hypothetical protein